MLPLLIVAGIFIKLETDKGQLVIESDVADVKVRIINDGKPVSELTIKHGTTATRLRADKYEVVIDGPSDGLTIENDRFTLKNGDIIVARIRVSPPRNPLASRIDGQTIQNAFPAKTPNELLFEGKTLSEWLEMLGRERSATGLNSSLDACRALVTPETSGRITQTLLSVLPGLDGKMDLAPSG